MQIKIDATAPAYKTLFASLSHVHDEAFLFGKANSADAWYMHACGTEGVIVRFGALGCDWEEVEAALIEEGFDGDTMPGFMELAGAAYAEGYWAIHFDQSADLIHGAAWSTGDTVIRPVAYNVDVLSFNDLTDTAREDMASTYGDCEAEDLNYFIVEEQVYCLSDCMRFNDGDKYQDYFDGCIQETAFSCMLIKLVDDGEYVDVARECA